MSAWLRRGAREAITPSGDVDIRDDGDEER